MFNLCVCFFVLPLVVLNWYSNSISIKQLRNFWVDVIKNVCFKTLREYYAILNDLLCHCVDNVVHFMNKIHNSKYGLLFEVEFDWQ